MLGVLLRAAAALLLLSASLAVLLAEIERRRMSCERAGRPLPEAWKQYGFAAPDSGGLGCAETYWGTMFPEMPFLGMMNTINRLVAAHPRQSRFYDLDFYFPAHRVLEEHYPSIRAEVNQLLEHQESLPSYQEVDERMCRIDPDRDWKVVVLKFYNPWTPNVRLAPFTTELLRRIGGVKAAMFSILQPGQKIPPHSGPWGGVSLRVHYAITVPTDGDVFISVDGVKHRWQEGKSMVIDDSYEHWVVNNATTHRVVLFMDIARRPVDGFFGDIVLRINEIVEGTSIFGSFFASYSRRVELPQAL